MEGRLLKSYAEAALVGLLAVEARKPTGRRFGRDADARWAAFRGDLTTADRIDTLIRDADAQWPGAFGARAVFAPRGVAEDDPFGPAWEGLDPVDAETLWRDVGARPSSADVARAVADVAACWGVPLTPVDVGTITATTRRVLAGPSMIAATIVAFARGTDLDWGDQIVVAASTPAARQLAAMAPALLNMGRPTVFADGSTKRPGWPVVVSADAPAADVELANEIVKEKRP